MERSEKKDRDSLFIIRNQYRTKEKYRRHKITIYGKTCKMVRRSKLFCILVYGAGIMRDSKHGVSLPAGCNEDFIQYLRMGTDNCVAYRL